MVSLLIGGNIWWDHPYVCPYTLVVLAFESSKRSFSAIRCICVTVKFFSAHNYKRNVTLIDKLKFIMILILLIITQISFRSMKLSPPFKTDENKDLLDLRFVVELWFTNG